jgi:integration host factor subunit beta
MTRSELIDRLSRRFPHLPPKTVDAAVRTLLDQMSKTVAARERVEIRHFGSFFCRTRKARVGRNPKTGEPVAIVGKSVARFRPARALIHPVSANKDTLSAT